MIRGGAVTLGAVLLAACVGPSAEVCPDGTVCASDRTCVFVPDPANAYACADRDQIAACTGKAEGDACSVGAQDGACYGGGCIVPVCGDGIISPGLEVCDDNNARSGDGCSVDCKSDETCGNGYTDLATGEQCDDAALAVSGDGCTSQCQREYDLWRDVTPDDPDFRYSAGITSDPARGAFVFGGGSLNPTGIGTVGAEFADAWRWDGATWQLLPSPAPTGRRMDMAIANDRHGQVLVFGGTGANASPLMDTWEWDGVTWRQRTITGGPMPRAGAALACAPGPAVSCVMFGGARNVAPNNETWKWNGSSWTQVTTTVTPPPRRGAGLVWDTMNNRYLLFGGTTGGTPLNDTWTFANDTWTQIVGAGGPAMASQLSMAWDETQKRAVLIASSANWFFTGTTWSTQGVSPAGNAPQIAWDFAAGKMLAITPDATTNTMRMYQLNSTAWSPVQPALPAKGAYAAPAAYDARRGVTVASGSSTFEWNGSSWRRTVATNPMTETEGAMLAYDAHCGATISFGGGSVGSGMTRSNETFRYPKSDGSLGWTAIAGAAPPARARHAMAYDRARHVTVVFGGKGASAPLADTWELASSDCATWTWSERTPSTSPTARSGAGLAYDARRGTTVLFGGFDGADAPLDETWEWDGTAWTHRITPADGTPPARGDHMMAFDPRRRRVLLFGGKTTAGRVNDTWEWDGTAGTWIRLAPAILQNPRAGSGFAPDITGDIVSINGENASGVGVSTVLRLSSELSTQPRETCTTVEDLDGDGLSGCADPDCWGRCTPACPPGETCTATDPQCGDGACDPLEDWLLCPADCPAPPP